MTTYTPDPQDYTPIASGDEGNTSPTGQPNTVNPTGLTNNAYGFLEQFEGVKTLPYADGKGYATVGVGMLLRNSPVAQQAYLINILGIQPGSAEYNQMVALLNKSPWQSTGSKSAGTYVSASQNLQNALSAVYGGSLPTLTADNLTTMWNLVTLSTNSQSQYELFLQYIGQSKYHIDTADLLNSKEGIALFSLSYNGVLAKSPALLSDLNENNFNRADAWFQIRYNSNGGSTNNGSVAARRYAESEIFGLYSPSDTTESDVTNTEALKIYAEFSVIGTSGASNRDVAFNYENLFTAYPSGSSTVNEIDQANDSLQSSYIESSSPAIWGTEVSTLEEELQWAADELISTYVTNTTSNPLIGATLGSTIISSLDVQVAAQQGGSDLIASQRSNYELGTGNYLPSLLIAQGGNDILDASSSNANVALIGGTGNDTIAGSSGNNYIVAGTGNDSITLQSGSDSTVVVLGDANNPSDGGHDTLNASQDTNNFTVYVGVGTQETIILGSGSPTIDLETGQGASGLNPSTLSINAQWIGPGEWYDEGKDALLVQQPGSSGQVNLNAATKNIVVIYGDMPGSGSGGAQAQKLSLSELESAYTADESSSGSSSTTTELTLEDFSGSDDDGVDLGAEPAGPTVSGSSNLSQLKYDGLVGDTTPGGDAQYVYENDASTGALSAIYGANTTGNPFGNEIQGDGNASYISAGNGNNTVLLGYFFNHATDPTAAVLSATILGGSGNQNLIGVGNGSETIMGGALGSDTTATTFIDGGGATADLIGGGQNSVIFGGTGADTLVASENDGTSGSGFNPTSILMAGLSFWGDAYSSVTGSSGNDYDVGSLPEVNWSGSPANVQVDLSLFQTDDTYGTPFNLLGSSYDSGSPGSTTLPGSLLIGGTGHDVLIGNSGNDTIMGGNPTDTVSGTTDEILIGGAGANLIYGGNGSEIIYADMGPGDVSGWATLDAADSDTVYGGDGQDVIYGSGGNDYLYGGSGIDQIYVGNGSSYVDAGSGTSSVYGGTGNDTIIAGGTSDYIETGDGNSSVSLSAGEATISTGAGNDTIDADSGGGTALITEGTGATTIMAGASTGSDTVQLGSGGTTIQLDSELDETTLVVRDVGGDLVLSDGGSMQLTLQGYFAAGGNVALQFSDGTTWGAAQILQASITPSDDGADDTLVGSNGNDSITAGYGDTLIVGVSGNNTLTGGEAADTIDGGSGADTIEGGSVTTVINGGTGTESYVYNLGDGSDTIWENTSVAGNDVLTFGAGISASDLSFIYDSSTDVLLATVTATGQTITVSNFVATQQDQHQLSALTFADGTSMTQLQVIQLASLIQGTTGNDSLIGNASANYFDGLGGNDTEVGDGGNDTFVFNGGYGQLEINETYTTGQLPVLQLGTGITESSLHVTSDGTNVILTDGISGDQIKLDNMWANSSDGVAVVQFADC